MTEIVKGNKNYVVRFDYVINATENFIYYSTRGLRFENLHPEFQRIMKEEFLSKKKES